VTSATVVVSGVERLGLVAAALLAGAALLAPSTRGRALATAAALVLTPLLLVAHIWNGEQLHALRERPLVVGAGAAVALAAVALAAIALSRRPSAVVLVALVAIPFRVPLHVAGTTANLLLPLYFVIAAGCLARVVRGLRAPPRERATPAGPLEWVLAAVVAVYAAQAAYSVDFDTAIQHVAFFYVPFLLLFALVAEAPWTRALQARCVAVLAGLGVLFCAVGAVEYATRSVLLNQKLMTHNAYSPSFRVNSLFYDPNIYGRFLVVVMLVVAAVIAHAHDRRRLAAGAVLLAVLWTGLVTSLSESSVGALLVGLVTLAAIQVRVPRAVAAVAATAVVALLALAVALPPLLGAGSGPVSLHRVTSGRSDLVRGGAELFAERPLQGWGSGSFAEEYRDQRKGRSRAAVSASHTTPLTVAVEQGMIGLALYTALLVAAARVTLADAPRSATTAAIAAVLVALVFHSLLYAAFLEEPLLWAFLGAAVGVRAATAPGRAAVRRDPGERPAAAAAAAP